MQARRLGIVGLSGTLRPVTSGFNFTHHDTYLHMHLKTTDRQKIGHLDEVLLKKGTMKLYLPAE